MSQRNNTTAEVNLECAYHGMSAEIPLISHAEDPGSISTSTHWHMMPLLQLQGI